MSLRHITHFPFMAKKVALINLQATPDDETANLRIWAKCDPVFEALCNRLDITIDPIPAWRPRDSVPINQIPSHINKYYVEKAKDLEEMAKFREQEAEDRRIQQMSDQIKALKLNDVQIEVGNYHVKIDPTYKDDKNVHKWTMAVRLPAHLSKQGYHTSDFVQSVEYTIHPTFSPNVFKVSSPFTLERRGWGTFDVGVKVTLKPHLKGPIINFEHHLNFTDDESFQLCKS